MYTPEFDTEAHEKAYDTVKDLLPSNSEIWEYFKWRCNPPRSPIMVTEESVYVLLEDNDHNIAPYEVLRRAFIASCSSCWSAGLHRHTGIKVSLDDMKVGLCGPCDPFEEITPTEIRTAITKTIARIQTGIPQPAGRFGIIVIELYDSYINGVMVTPEFFMRLSKFRKYGSSCRLNQAKYGIAQAHDNHLIMLLEGNQNKYDQYVLNNLRTLNNELKIVVGLGIGDVYYWSKHEIYSSTINDIWHMMKACSPEQVVLGPDGSIVADRLGLPNNTPVML